MAATATIRPTRRAARPDWIAGSDRISHAHLRGNTRTVCGEPRIDLRLAWPMTRRCIPCLAVVGLTMAAPR